MKLKSSFIKFLILKKILFVNNFNLNNLYIFIILTNLYIHKYNIILFINIYLYFIFIFI